jgi:hypothetical protein
LLESIAVKDIKKACFNVEINLPPKTFMLFPNEVHVIECIEIFAGYYILRSNLTLASISFLVHN